MFYVCDVRTKTRTLGGVKKMFNHSIKISTSPKSIKAKDIDLDETNFNHSSKINNHIDEESIIASDASIGSQAIILKSMIGRRTNINNESKIEDSEIGADCIIWYSVNIKSSTIGNGNEIKNSVTIDSHTIVKNDCLIECYAKIGKNVKIGKGCYIGNSVIIEDGVTIGDYCMIKSRTVISTNTSIPDCFIANESEN